MNHMIPHIQDMSLLEIITKGTLKIGKFYTFISLSVSITMGKKKYIYCK